MNQIRVACIGAGHWGRNLIRNFHALEALGAICDTTAQAREVMAGEYPDVALYDAVDAVLDDPRLTAVAIATPAETHGVLVRRAIEAGKDVFVEKPLCMSLEEGRALVELAQARGRILMVGHLLWYHPAIVKLQALVQAGELGRIRYIYSTRLNLGRIRREENILWSFAPHDISVMLGLTGEMPDRVQTQGGNYLHERIADVTVSAFSFPSGIKAHIFVSWLHPYKEQKLVVVGERKMAVFDDLQPTDKLVLYPHTIEWRNQVPVPNRAEAEIIPLDRAEPLRVECATFLTCVSERRTPPTDGLEALRVLSVLKACQACIDEPTMPVPAHDPPPVPDYFVHESSYIDEDVTIGVGTTIWHFSHVLRDSRIGQGCRIGQNVVIGPRAIIGSGVKIQNNVSVYEGVHLEDDVFCGPSVVFTNVINPRSAIRRMDELRPTRVERGASLGANSTIVCGITIGRFAFVGAGAVVARDVPRYALVVGNPARVAGWMCECGNRIQFADAAIGACTECGARYTIRDEQVDPVAEAATVPEMQPLPGR